MNDRALERDFALAQIVRLLLWVPACAGTTRWWGKTLRWHTTMAPPTICRALPGYFHHTPPTAPHPVIPAQAGVQKLTTA